MKTICLTRRIARALSFVQQVDYPANGSERRFNWRDAIIDALIIAGLNFFATLSGISITQIIHEPCKALLASAISAGLGFFSTLALKRGLLK